ncbi:rhodanese-like domain-containing protein [Kiritimatiella glycovorans]|uniref:Molybdopterin biosynthesis protein MoeB n=1 Tax=Kiritimatiella glycovorans TaxID=1307763 RepID=A0A0G3EL68_9BACT|nr:rhodanese-like domain-containing protein [Kiritimatiella glycovorans]AKJ64874.1 molybdopterin biosynthesis protein MoeB [Kiritimatiella glycovorans]
MIVFPMNRYDLRQAGLLLLASVLCAVVSNAVRSEPLSPVRDEGPVDRRALDAGLDVVGVEEVQRWIGRDGVTFVDVRPCEDGRRGHLPGAVPVPRQPEGKLALCASGDRLVFYCSGSRCEDALRAALDFRASGCTRVAVFAGGMEAWAERGGEAKRMPGAGDEED